MSRVARIPVTLPAGADVQLADETITVKGPLGTLVQPRNPQVTIATPRPFITLGRSSRPR